MCFFLSSEFLFKFTDSSASALALSTLKRDIILFITLGFLLECFVGFPGCGLEVAVASKRISGKRALFATRVHTFGLHSAIEGPLRILVPVAEFGHRPPRASCGNLGTEPRLD